MFFVYIFRQGHDGHHYVALMDTQALGDESRPRYRCAQYNQDEYSGEIKFALSSDSTCTNRLTSPTDGYETLGNKHTIKYTAGQKILKKFRQKTRE